MMQMYGGMNRPLTFPFIIDTRKLQRDYETRRRRWCREQERKRRNLLWLLLEPLPRGGSTPGKRRNKDRKFEQVQRDLEGKWFAPNPTYGPAEFVEHYRLPRLLYLELKYEILDWEATNLMPKERFFEQRTNCAGQLGAFPDQKLLC